MKIGVSFLKSIYPLEETIDKILATDTDYVHIDVMDGEYVESKSVSIEEIISLFNNKINKPLDIHLMVSEPTSYIKKLAILKPQYITFHSDISNVDNIIDLIKSYGIGVGLAINPNVDVKNISKYLPLLDYVLVMGVYPGKGGQTMIMDTTKKVDELITIRNENNYNYIISFDGGVNKETINSIRNIDLAITGSYICMKENYQEAIDTLR